MRRFVVIISLLVGVSMAWGVPSVAYDPLLDPDVTLLQNVCSAGEAPWMWYPGQLAAYSQRKCLQESDARCVNVGYPGNFYAPVDSAMFRTELISKIPTNLIWHATGRVTAYVDGIPVDSQSGNIVIGKGKHRLVFKVSGGVSLPSLLVEDSGLKWQASVNGVDWVPAEWDSRRCNPEYYPDNMPEIIAQIPPKTIMPVRNTKVEASAINIGKNGMVLIDFFHLEKGRISLVARGNGKLRFYVGETAQEAFNRDVKKFEQFDIEPVILDASYRRIELPVRALRYLAIESEDNAHIDSLILNAEVSPVDFKMSFNCDDDHINDIFNMGAATLHASTHDFYLDGIKRDFLPWSMDAVASTFAGDYLFGDRQVSRNCISVAMLPKNPKQSDLGIADYPLHALIGLRHYLQRYGDDGILEQYRDRVLELMDLYTSLVDEKGFLTQSASKTGFIPGWSTKNGPDGRGVPAYAQMMLFANYKIAADLCRVWHLGERVRDYERKASILRANILSEFWDSDKSAFINGYDRRGKRDTRISHHAQYWGVLTDLFPKEHYDVLFTKVLPAIPHYYEDISYEKVYEFMAYSKAAHIPKMWRFLEVVFGDWMKQGHSRFPENFSPAASAAGQLGFYGRPFGLSLCHGANGAAPIVAVLNGILGFTNKTDIVSGSGEYDIIPDMMHLRHIDARIPIKEGFIELHLRKGDVSNIVIPDGCCVNISDKGKLRRIKGSGSYTFIL